MSLPSARSKNKENKLKTCCTLVSCLAYSSTMEMEATHFFKTLEGIHDGISHKMEPFIATDIKTSNPTIY
jgi:hypothetical protein